MISVTIITLNEQANIEKAIKSVLDLADEIIVVDSGSKDKTVELAEKLGAKVFFKEFADFASQKNYAASKATKEWVLSLDPDEEISPSLSEEIRSAVSNNLYDGFLIGRKNFILKKEIKYSRWSPDEHIWLWKKDHGEWEGLVHEEIKLKGNIGKLIHKKIHHQSDNITDFMKSNNFYSGFEAEDRFKKGEKFSLLKLFYDPVYEFLIRFVYKLGFLDGKVGFILAYIMAIYKITVSVKIYQLQLGKKNVIN